MPDDEGPRPKQLVAVGGVAMVLAVLAGICIGVGAERANGWACAFGALLWLVALVGSLVALVGLVVKIERLEQPGNDV